MSLEQRPERLGEQLRSKVEKAQEMLNAKLDGTVETLTVKVDANKEDIKSRLQEASGAMGRISCAFTTWLQQGRHLRYFLPVGNR